MFQKTIKRESLFQFEHIVSHNHETKQIQDKYPIRCYSVFSNDPWFCLRSPPNPSKLASIFNYNGKFGSKIFLELELTESMFSIFQ